MRWLVLVLLATTACADSGDSGVEPADAGTSGDANSCGVTVSYDPFDPVAHPTAPIRVRAVVNAPGVYTYHWRLIYNGGSVAYTYEASDESQIGFVAPDPGTYFVSVDAQGPAQFCYGGADINVGAPGANDQFYRLRTLPPNSIAPPQESVIQVKGGSPMYERSIALDPGALMSGTVRNTGGTGIEAYVRFAPISTPNGFIETFSSATGAFSLRLLPLTHDVLVIPKSSTLAPKRVTWMPGTQSLTVGGGTLVSGTVRGPGGAGFSGAKVQLAADGVPSTIGTTAADGSFSLRADFAANANVIVKVTPPAASGLPRLEATAVFDLAQAMQINYASLQTCDLGGTAVRRDATNQANAKVTIVGTLAGTAATITAGVSANATGTVRSPATASDSGVLPSTLVPRAQLSAVVHLGATDYAIDPIDTLSCAAQTIDAPATVTAAGTTNTAQGAIGGVKIEATPVGVLALADALPITVISSSNGAFSLPLAAGGHYDVRFVDPLSRGGALIKTDVTSAGVPTMATLPPAVKIFGKVSVIGNSNPVVGASVQLLCSTCSGIAASRPIAQDATDSDSDYSLAVPDPGTM